MRYEGGYDDWQTDKLTHFITCNSIEFSKNIRKNK